MLKNAAAPPHVAPGDRWFALKVAVRAGGQPCSLSC